MGLCLEFFNIWFSGLRMVIWVCIEWLRGIVEWRFKGLWEIGGENVFSVVLGEI